MKKVLLAIVVSVGLLAGSVSLADATSDWGDAIAIPDLIALNTGNNAFAESVSCPSAGNCAVTGYYNNGAGPQGFVVNLDTPITPVDPVVPAVLTFTG